MDAARKRGSAGLAPGLILGAALGLLLGLAAVVVRPRTPAAPDLRLSECARALVAELGTVPAGDGPIVSRETYEHLLNALPAADAGELPDPAAEPATRHRYRLVVGPHRFRPHETLAGLLDVEPWLQDSARLATALEHDVRRAATTRIPWSLVALALATDLRTVGSIDYLRAAEPLERLALEFLQDGAEQVCRTPSVLAETYRLLRDARDRAPTVAHIVASERRMSMATFLALADVEPFADLRRRFLLSQPPAAAVMADGMRALDEYPGRLRQLLSNIGDEHERWNYLQWSSRLTRHCPEAGLVVATPESVIGFDHSVSRLLLAELRLRLTEEYVATGRYPESARPIFTAVVAADPRLPADLVEPMYRILAPAPGFELSLCSATDQSLRRFARDGSSRSSVLPPTGLPSATLGIAAARSER